ncbi:hypothetical protein FQA39_LY17434 [Lamprigera yunnana]|nr:hypothetical protein FQA39_LY17434 [Lamprigera yunnana]
MEEIEIIKTYNTNDAFRVLSITFGLMILMWYLQYHWRRRHLYKMASMRPGPLTLPLIGNALSFVGSSNDMLSKLMEIMNKYQSPVRLWLGNKLLFGVWEARDMEIILNSSHALTKEELYKFTECVVGTGLFTAPVPKWKRHRKIIMPTFNQRTLNEFVGCFSEQSNIFVNQLEKQVGRGFFDIFYLISRCTLDIICETAIGITVKAQTEDSDYAKWINKGMEIICIRMCNILYRSDYIFNRTSMSKELKDLNDKVHQFTGGVVKQKREAYQKKMREQRNMSEGYVDEGFSESITRKSLLQLLIELSENGAGFTDDELRNEVDTFMIAGSDTTASTMSFTFIMLAMFPDIQQKVYEEVMDVLGPDRIVEHSDLNKFEFLEQVLKETMRIFPVGPFLVRSITKDIQLEKCVLPAGSSVMLGIISLHRNEEIWPSPLKFDPDRFLPENVAKRHSYAWLPFSGGPRNCVGLKKYKFSTTYKSIEDIKLKVDIMLKPIDGYAIAIEFRE